MQLQLELSQKQTINQRMLQSIRILQMNSIELDHFLEELCLENPVIELDPEMPHTEEDFSYERQLLLQRSSEWLISTDQQNRPYYEDDSENGTDYWQNPMDKAETLEEHLHTQILTRKYTELEQAMMDFLIHSLNSHGFLEETCDSIAPLFSVPVSFVQRMIQELQTLDPPGVGSSDFTECLILQIDRLKMNGELPADISAEQLHQIIRFHLEDIGSNHLHKIMRDMNLSREKVEQCCTVIRSLTPRPAAAFAARDYVQYVTPDSYVLEYDQKLEVVMNDSGRRRFHASPYYLKLKDETEDPQLKQYLQEKIRQIQNTEKDISQRSSTIYRVIQVIVKKQEGFFFHGPGNRSPLGLKDIAAELELHESTVSRALQDKYLQCKWGVFPLHYFLTSAAISSADNAGETRENIEQKIRDLIKTENRKKPLSDQAIADRLSDSGILISRRTVNKYRVEMGIPDKSGRKI